MNTMLLDNYTQFGNNGSNNIFTVDTYQVNTALDASMFDINSAEFQGITDFRDEQTRPIRLKKLYKTIDSYCRDHGFFF